MADRIGKPISQRQLRVGEMIKQSLSMIFIRNEAKVPNLETKTITVTEVRMSQDLKIAKAYVLPLGGKDAEETIDILKEYSFLIRKILSQKIVMKFLNEMFKSIYSYKGVLVINMLYLSQGVKVFYHPSVFSLDLPSTGITPEEREENKRLLNLRMIDHIITALPNSAKHCVSYGQLTKTYFTVPATSTQGTTKESDKDYIVRVAMPPEMDMDALLSCFDEFSAQERLMELK